MMRKEYPVLKRSQFDLGSHINLTLIPMENLQGTAQFFVKWIERLFYAPNFLADCTSCTMTQMTFIDVNMIAGHGQIVTY